MNKLTALLLCVFALALPCAAQTTGSINGVLTDASQAVVAEAELIVFNMDTGETRKAVASREGYFAVTDLQPGRYGIRVSMAGFKALVLQPLELTVGQHMTVNPVLQVGAVSESIEVSAAPPPVTTAFSSLSQTVDSQRIAQLPLNGRNALQLVALAPGVVQAGTAGQFGARQITFNVAGGRNIDMNFTLDGGQNMNSFWNIPVAYPNPDTLQEFVVTTRHYSATLGRGTSSVAAVSKSGTNEFHGTAYEFLRNTELDARSFFAANRSIFKRNQYGGSAGGPIARNKAFFLVGYQATKARGTPGESSYRTFTAEERAGNFSGQTKVVKDPDNGGIAFPGNIIPASRIRPFAKNFMQQFLPPANFGPDYYRYSLLDESNEDQLTARVDYSFSDKDKIYFRYFLNEVKQVGTNNAIDWDFVSDFPGRFQNFNFGYTRVFSPTLLNDLRLTHARNAASVINRKKFSLAALGMPVDLTNSPTEHGLTPQSVLAVSGQFTINLGAPTRDILPTTHFTDTLSWMHGKHQMTFGAEVYRNRVNEIQNWLTGGNISFDGSASGVSAADMLLGKFNSYRQISGFASRLRQTLPAFFVQDDIRATRRLTLNVGLRFEPIMGYVSENDLMMTFAPGKKSTMFPNAPTGLLYPGDADVPRSIFPTNWKTFAPRVGLAWDVFGDGRTSLRAGVGIFYVPLTRGISYNRFPLIQPFTADVTISGGDIDHLFDRAPFNGVSPYPRPDVSDLAQLKRMQFIPTANETAFMLPFKTQTDSQWSVSIQRAITRSGVLEAAYVGSSAAHLFTSLEANPAVYTPGRSTLANTQSRRLYPDIGSVNAGASVLSSNYNALQVTFNQRYTHGVAIQSAYTWSKALGVVGEQGEGSNGPRDPNHYRVDYGPLGADRRHNFISSVMWDLPFFTHAQSRLVRGVAGGWQVSAIVSLVSGEPLTPRSGRDNALLGIGRDTADQVADWRLPDSRSKADQILKWFNPAAFVQNVAGTVGNVGIGGILAPGNVNCDLALAKTFRFSERRNVQFRGSFFNALNHANLGSPNMTQSSPAFGRISGASAPRVIELGLKLAF